MTDEMSDWDIQASARLTSHEFLLEILYADWLAQLPKEAADAIAEQIIRKTRSSFAAIDADPDAIEAAGFQVVSNSTAMTQGFFDKAIARADDIRRQKSSDS